MAERIDAATRDLYRPVPLVACTHTYLTQMRCPECGKLLSGLHGKPGFICQACGYERRVDAAKVKDLQRKHGYRSPGGRIGVLFGKKSV